MMCAAFASSRPEGRNGNGAGWRRPSFGREHRADAMWPVPPYWGYATIGREVRGTWRPQETPRKAIAVVVTDRVSVPPKLNAATSSHHAPSTCRRREWRPCWRRRRLLRHCSIRRRLRRASQSPAGGPRTAVPWQVSLQGQEKPYSVDAHFSVHHQSTTAEQG